MNEYYTKTAVRLTEGTENVSGDNLPHVPGSVGTREGGSAVSVRGGTGDAGLPTQSPTGSPTVQAGQTPGGGISPTSPLAQMHSLIERAGEMPFPPEVQAILSQDAPEGIIDIKPNGAIYVSHPYYRDVLDRAFGVGGWALVPLEPPRIKGDRAIWYGFLKARGQYIESAYGGCTFVPKNREMNEDDAVEGAKSDCLTRCCKAFPLFRNLWNGDFAAEWKAQYAYQVENPNYPGRKIWKKKGIPMTGVEGKPGRGYQSPFRKPARIQDENQQHIDAIATDKPLRLQANDEYNDNADYYDDAREGE